MIFGVLLLAGNLVYGQGELAEVPAQFLNVNYVDTIRAGCGQQAECGPPWTIEVRLWPGEVVCWNDGAAPKCAIAVGPISKEALVFSFYTSGVKILTCMEPGVRQLRLEWESLGKKQSMLYCLVTERLPDYLLCLQQSRTPQPFPLNGWCALSYRQ
jgi:hypothetical protein